MSLSILEGVVAGVFSGIFPSVHPMLFPLPPLASALAHGVYATLSILPVVWFMFVDPENFASTNAVSRLLGRGRRYVVHAYAWGAILSIPFFALAFPLSSLLSIRPPRLVVTLYLLLLSVALLAASRRRARAFLVAFLASFLGFLALRWPIDVSRPIVPLVAGLYGLSDVLLSRRPPAREGEPYTPGVGVLGPVSAGVLAGLLVSYFPAMSVSIALLLFPFFSGDEGFLSALGAATVSSYAFSIIGRQHGLVRTSLAAAIPPGDPLVYILALFAGVGLGSLLAVFLTRINVPARLAFVVVPLFVAYSSGPLSLLLLLASAALGVLARALGVEKRILAFSLIAPTLLFYA